jgi:hypothetical protein
MSTPGGAGTRYATRSNNPPVLGAPASLIGSGLPVYKASALRSACDLLCPRTQLYAYNTHTALRGRRSVSGALG